MGAYLELIRQQEKTNKQETELRTNMLQAAETDPDSLARAKKSADMLGLPLQAVQERLPEVEKQAFVEGFGYRDLIKNSPKTAEWLQTDTLNAGVAKDDIENLTLMESILARAEAYPRSLAAGPFRLNAALWGIPRAGTDLLSTLVTKPLSEAGILPEDIGANMSKWITQRQQNASAFTSRVRGDLSQFGPRERAALGGVESAGQTLVAAPLSVVTGNPSFMLGTLAASTGGESYAEARDKGVPVAKALNFATSQAVIEYATEKIPAGILFRDLGLKRSLLRTLTNQLITEMPQEQVATVLQDLNEWAVLNPDKPFSSYIAARPEAALQTAIATAIGTTVQTAATTAVDTAVNGPRHKQNEAIFKAIGDTATNSKLRERLPEKFQELAAKYAGAQNVFVSAEQFQQYFQSQNIDPAAVAAELNVSNYEEALTAGTDVVIPMADFASKLAPTDYLDGLLPDLKLAQGELSAREYEAWQAEGQAEAEAGIDTGVDEGAANTRQQVYDDILGQLVNRFERSTAEAYAQQYTAGISTMAERIGVDPWELHQRYGLSVTSPLPEVLTRVPNIDTMIDPMIDALRAGKVPTDAEVNGPSLTEFLRGIGGIQDEGGELKSRDAQKQIRGLVKKKGGLSFDRARELAAEAGYMSEDTTVADFLDALDAELRGNPVYSMRNQNAQAAEQRDALSGLGEWLDRLGVDLNTVDNNAVKALIESAKDGVQGEPLYDQSAFHGSPYRFDKFSLEHLGKGEGAQAYGWGLYFAGKRKIAEWYRKSLIPDEYRENAIINDLAKNELQSFDGDVQKAIASLKETLAQDWSDKKRVRKIIKVLEKGKPLKEYKGQLYEVNIPEDDTMLLWDKPLSEQPEKVKDALAKHDPDTYSPDGEEYDANETGQMIYMRLSSLKGSDEAASKFLHSIGINGNKYLDGTSRNRNIAQIEAKIRVAERRIKMAEESGNKEQLDIWTAKLKDAQDEFDDLSFNYVIFDDNAIEVVETFYQTTQDGNPIFYSALYKGIQGAKQESMPAAQWKAWLAGNAAQLGIKKEEIEWTGINEYLELRGKDKLAKQDVLDYLAQNGVKVEEVMLGTTMSENEIAYQAVQQYVSSWGYEFDDRGPDGYSYVIDPETNETIAEGFIQDIANQFSLEADEADDSTKYGDWQLPGGKNYRELLLKLPPTQIELEGWKVIRPDGLVDGTYADKLSARVRADDISGTIEKAPVQKGETGYRSKHWSDLNILAHIRLNDRTDADGKRVLFVEEIQSDWGQEGKKQGFGDGITIKEDVNGMYRAYDRNGNTIEFVIGTERFVAMTTAQAVRDALQTSPRPRGIPEAPFVGETKSWVALSVKRIMRYAAENGYDSVAFINGQQSADRYDLSKQIDSIIYTGQNALYARKVGQSDYNSIAYDLNEDQLEDYIGKDAANKILQAEKDENGSRSLDGIDLKVGGEGMIAFYDKIVPSVVNEQLKKVGGGKLSNTTLMTGEGQYTGMYDIYPAQGGESYAGPFVSVEEAERFKSKPDDRIVRIGSSEQPAFTITDEMRQSIMKGLPLFQDSMGDKRGYIQIGANRQMSIALLEKADLSTFLHETGHMFLEVLGDLAEAENAPEQIRTDYKTILDWFGVENRSQITTEHHEKFARANEAYLMEGKAPSTALRKVFAKFKVWLKFIYRTLTNLNVNLTPEVRAVFDRIYASDAEIEQAESESGLSALFTDATAAGMTDAEFAAYRDTIEMASVKAQDELRSQMMREYQREQAKWWKAERAKMRETVAAEVAAQPVYQAFASLTGGDTKLAKIDLIRRYGDEYLKRLPRSFQRVYAAEGGMNVDMAAEMFGFESGDALVEALVNMRPAKELIEAETDARMREQYGDMRFDGSMADKADHALHNDMRADVLMAELRALRRKQREVAPFVRAERQRQAGERRAARDAASSVPPADYFKNIARGMVSQQAVKDLQPYTYLLAERKASRKSFQAMAKGDVNTASMEKQRELLNHYLYLEATKAKETADKIAEYMAKFDKKTTRQKLGKAGDDYLEQIDNILGRYEFRRIPLRTMDRRASLLEWAAQQEADGMTVNIPNYLLDEARQVNYRNVTLDELEAIYDTVRNIEHLANLKTKLLRKGKMIEFEDAKRELIDSLIANMGSTGELDKLNTKADGVSDRLKKAVRSFDASMIKVEQLIEWMDGGNIDGPWARYVFDQAADAQNAEYDLHKKITEQIVALHEAMPKEWRTSLLDRVTTNLDRVKTRYDLLSVAMNVGNESNYDKMLRGMKWDEADVQAALDQLTEADWKFVQGIWDTLETMWPEIAELEKRVTGVTPPRVQARTVNTAFGDFRGGYFPIVYDPRSSEAGAKQDDAGKSVQDFMARGYGRANTDKGATKERVEGFAAPFRLDYEQVLTSHMAKVIKDISHREAVISLNKILRDPEIKAAMIDALGEDRYQLFNVWEQRLISDRSDTMHQGLGAWGNFFRGLRTNTAIVTMGWKISTMLAQFAGFGPSADLVKKRNLASAMVRFMKSPNETVAFVTEKSGEMRNRTNTLERDVKDAFLKLRGNNSKMAGVQRTAFYLTAMADRMVSIPTWLGGYEQALAEGKTEEDAIRAGDRAVRMSQGAGGAKDLASVQSNNELMRLLTMYYTPFSVLYSRMRDVGYDVNTMRDLPRAAARSIALVILPAVMGELLAGRGPDDDEDEVLWAVRKIIMYPLSSIPMLRDLAAWKLEPALAEVSGGSMRYSAEYQFSPALRAIEKVARLPSRAYDAYTGDRPWDDVFWDALETSGYVFGLPTAQARITGEYLENLLTGDGDDVEIQNILFRAPPKQ